jgi:hypothetical protein
MADNGIKKYLSSMKMKCRFIRKLHLLAGLLIVLQNCTAPDESGQNTDKWTSTDPLVVNHRIRAQRFHRGNQIYNASFEQGKMKRIDTLSKQLFLDGWDILGNDVKWIGPGVDPLLNIQHEVHSGLHSIRVTRIQADETEDFGQGVLSDYIKVIPGNYLLSLYIKLKNIHNPKSRLGTKIYDAIDFRVLYYDRNKLQIKGEQYSPHFNTTINNSFKGYSFSNFEEIDSTGWMHITGRSQLFPFSDGDLPDETKFVRIFIGLKGTGTLWADDISFEYTRWNFTLLEKLSIYFDSTLAKSELIVPLPRKMNIRESKIYYQPEYKSKLPIIIVPASADAVTLHAAQCLEDRIRESLIDMGKVDSTKIPKITSNVSIDDLMNASLIFSIGKTNLFNQNTDELPVDKIIDHQQGYFIQSIDALSNIIFIYGNTPIANYYAVQSVVQLFDSKRLLFHNANVIDYPADNNRAILFTDFNNYALNLLRSSNKTRFNTVYLPGSSDAIFPLLTNLKEVDLFSKYIYYDFSDSNSHDGNAKQEQENYFKITSNMNKYNRNITGVAYLYNPPFSNGISLENLLNHYYYMPKCNFDYGFLSSLTNFAHKKSLKVEILPWCSDNLCLNICQYASSDFIEDHKNIIVNNISLMWSGYGLQSWRIDEADLLRIRQAYETYPVFLDFTLYPRDQKLDYFANNTQFPYKLLTGSLFESYSNEIVPEVYTKVDKTILVYSASNVFDKIRLQTASDFFWNPDKYDPDLSLFRVLVAEFGTDATKDLLKFNDLYFRIKSELILTANQKNKHKHMRKASLLMNELKIVKSNLSVYNNNNALNELNIFLNALVKELEDKNQSLNISPFWNLKYY